MKIIITILLATFGLNVIQAEVLVFKGSQTESRVLIPGEGIKTTTIKKVGQRYMVVEINGNNRIINLALIDFDTKEKEYGVWEDLDISPNRMTGFVLGKDKAIITYQDFEIGDYSYMISWVAEGSVKNGSVTSLAIDGHIDLVSMTVKGVPFTAEAQVLTDDIREGVLDYMSRDDGQTYSDDELFSWVRGENSLEVTGKPDYFTWTFKDEFEEEDGWLYNLKNIDQKKSYVAKDVRSAKYSIAKFAGATYAAKVAAVEALLKKQKLVKVDDY